MTKGTLRINNIFKYATSELSQDAFICWLLSYATEDGWYVDYQLRKCAVAFMDKILQSKGSCWNADTRITGIYRQYKNIDILVEVRDFKIIIEDKTFTCSHGDQVNRYKKSLLDEGVPEEKIICVFYKIEEQPEPEPNVDVEFTRKILLSIFRNYKSHIQHPIFIDYLEYLEWLDIRDYKLLRAVTLGQTWEDNLELDLIYDLAERHYSSCRYVGIYNEKVIKAVGKVYKVIVAEVTNGKLVHRVQGGGELATKEELERIEKAIVLGDEHTYDLRNKKHRYYLVEKFYSTAFVKESSGGLRKAKFFDLEELLGTDNLPSTEEIAIQLSGKTWK